MQIFLWHVDDPKHAGVSQFEAEHHLSAALGLALNRKRHFELVLGDIVGVNIDLNVDRWWLLLRRQRRWRIRIFKRKVLGVLRQHVQLGRRGRLRRRAIAVGHKNLPGTFARRGSIYAPEFADKVRKRPVGRVAIIGAPASTRRNAVPATAPYPSAIPPLSRHDPLGPGQSPRVGLRPKKIGTSFLNY